ncbi:MAG: hypothetical protein SVO26_04095 [Chloroflexota bacterium]|nr:hypothetical protein [Chloroflexota bacterium]
MDKLKKIEAFSEKYINLLTSETMAFREAGSWEKVRQDWWLALIFFFDRAFYQGRSDKISSYFEQATIKAMDSVLPGSSSEERLLSLEKLGDWLDREKWGSQGNPLWDALCKKYDIGEGKKYGTGRESDRKMVLSSLNFIVNHCDNYNILEHSIQNIQNGEIVMLSNKLHDIFSIGDKITSLFLRDTVFLYSLETYLKPEDYYYVLPVDTWVRKIADKLGIEANAKAMAIACQQNNVSPIKFNQGAWYLGSHSFSELLDML